MSKQKSRISYVIKDDYQNPQHRQGINTMAIDVLSFERGEGGLLYSGARDSIINVWNIQLDIEEKQTLKTEEIYSENQQLEIPVVPEKSNIRNSSDLSIEQQYDGPPLTPKYIPKVSFDEQQIRLTESRKSLPTLATIYDILKQNEQRLPIPKPTKLHKTLEGHSDWVNEIVLFNQSQSLLSCSSDRSVRLWNLTDHNLKKSVILGYHNDYVKRLVQPSQQSWAVSGGLDKNLYIWDLKEPSKQPQLLGTVDSMSGSIYALGTNKSGSIVASGSPDKVIRIWDPRVKNEIFKIQGHTDNIRDILVNDDGTSVLSASADTTIKLWSLKMPNHCLESFNHSESSIWCLTSNSPNFDTFWAGAKDGWIYKISTGNYSECIGICKEKDSVLKIAAIDDTYIWSATTSSTINRWRDVPFSDYRDIIVPANCYIRHDTIDETESVNSKRFSSVSGVEERFESQSVFSNNIDSDSQLESPLIPLWSTPHYSIEGVPGIKKHLLLNNRRHVVTQDTSKNVCVWDIISCSKLRDCGQEDFDTVCQRENTIEWVANWCTIDTKNGDLTIHMEEGKCYDSEIYYQDLNLPEECKLEDQRVNIGKWVLTYILNRYLRKVYPTDKSLASLDEFKNVSRFGILPPLQVNTERNDSEKFVLNTPFTQLSIATPFDPSLPTLTDNTPTTDPNDTPKSPISSRPDLQKQISIGVMKDVSTESPSELPKEPPSSVPTSPVKPPPARQNSLMDHFRRKRAGTGNSQKSEDVSNTPPPAPVNSSPVNASQAQPDTSVNQSIKERGDIINFDETPRLKISPCIPVIFSQEQSPSMFISTYRGHVEDLGRDKGVKDVLPIWVKDWIVDNIQPIRDPAKLSFVLNRHPKSTLTEIPQDSNRLTANRMLRIRKVQGYIADKLGLRLDPQCDGSRATPSGGPLVYLDIFCNGKLLNYRDTLASIKYMICKGGGNELSFVYCERI
ncbi:WD40-repeat-containing domain protein [Globomyces pollinis-pini]|nr:WD40-repeat-containing domain protein [Globomyces pollinis-pini]